METETTRERLARYAGSLEAALAAYLPPCPPPEDQTASAMGYSLLGGGKRIRGSLVLAFYHLYHEDLSPALPYAGALEMVHERVLVPIFARRMDGILTVSNSTKNYLVRHFRVPEERITVAYNGIGSEYHPRDVNSLSEPGRYGVQAPYVFHISRFSERKNPWVLLEAFSRFAAGHSYKLVCAGSGWDNPQVREKAQALGIQDQLVCPGFVSEHDAAEFLSGAEFFVFPSLAEGFGIPNVEAMAAGCPVITTAAFAISEVVGDAAIVIQDPRDSRALAQAMEYLANNPEPRERLIRKGFERIHLFSWDEAARKLLTMYDRILGET
jgi:glycosyltransferase involved in cell wall biosynthesis